MRNRTVTFSALLSFFLVFILNSKAMAYFTVGESGELIKPGHYDVGVEPQFVFDNSGFNFEGFFDAPAGKDGSLRAKLGIGNTNFEAAVSYKYIPIPDYGNQPAIGGKVEANYASRSSGNWDALRLMPLVSKNFETVYGPVTPYASLPLSLVSAPGSNITTIQLVGGCEYHAPAYQKWMFAAEIGVNLNNAFSYISGNVTYYLDEKDVVPTRKH